MRDEVHRRLGLAAAAEILNEHIDPGEPRAALFGRIYAVIVGALEEAESEIDRARREPSRN